MSRLAGARAVLRIARRDAARHKGRSLLVVLMIALPVFAVTGVDVLARTAQLDPADVSARELGRRADVALTVVGGEVQQSPDGRSYDSRGAGSSTVDVQELFPGRPVLTDRQDQVGIQTEAGTARVGLRELDYADSLATGLVRQLVGRSPRSPAEVALTPALSERTGAGVGDTVQLLRPDRSVTVVGLVDPAGLRQDDEVALALPGAVLPEPETGVRPTRYLVDTAEPVGWDEVLRLNRRGVAVISRAVLLDPPPSSEVPYYQGSTGPSTATLAAVGLAAGMALLEVVLLAGPAFAVGARRSRRSLALLAATGGERRHVRAVVLGQGLVLGAVGAVTGVALGVAVAAAAIPVLTSRFNTDFGSFDLRPLELLAIAGVGMLTAVLAAIVPARGAARQDVVAALAGRRGQVATARREPVLGLLMVGAGVLVAGGGAARRSATLILAGSALAEIGLVVCSPTLVGFVGRAGRFLPLTPRLALRDASRNRSRTAPAVSAVMAAVAGSVAAGIYVASLSAHDELTYTPSLPPGYAAVELRGWPGVDVGALQAAVAPLLPVTSTTVLRGTSAGHDASTNISPVFPPENQCPLFGELYSEPSEAELAAVRDDPRCASFFAPSRRYSFTVGTLVDDGSVLAALTGVDDQQARAVLDRGGAVVFDPLLVQDGSVQLERLTYTDDGAVPEPPETVTVPAVAVPSAGPFPPGSVVLSPALAQQQGLTVAPEQVLFATDRTPTEQEEDAANAALQATGADTFLQVERGYLDDYGPGLLALVVASAVVVVGATAIATGLAMTDARPDLATLAAVGASAGVRRRLSMSQALVVAGLGTGLGAVAGFVPARAAVWAQQRAVPEGIAGLGRAADNNWPLTIPWTSLAVTALVVPLVAALAAGLFTRSRLPLARRLAA